MRSARLLDLIQLLRRHRRPVSGADLAREMSVSLRTLYRDIGTLKAQGADIAGEPGLGYVLRPGFMLPPLMFGEDELEALVLGSRWVAERGDARLAEAARQALAKIGAVLPADLAESLRGNALLVGPSAATVADAVDLGVIRGAIRGERKLAIGYRDGGGAASERLIWPFGLGYFDHVRVVLAWCELRDGFRSFRTDRICRLESTSQRYPRRRQALMKAWRAAEGIGESAD